VNLFMEYSQAEITRFALILARVSPLMIIAPIWGSPLVPGQVRIFLSLIIAGLLLPVVRTPLPAGVAASAFPLGLAIALELALGFLLAYIALLLFAAAQFAGQLVDIQIGFGVANVIDPLSSSQVSLVGQMQYLAALWVFLLLDGHHLLLRGLAGTFVDAPLGDPLGSVAPIGLLVERAGRVLFSLGLQIAAPALTALFLSNFALGLVSRMMPQMNLFLVGLPMHVVVGLLALAASLAVFTSVWRGAIDELGGQLGELQSLLRQSHG
jgi:flagellar biosynthetic protein FliR